MHRNGTLAAIALLFGAGMAAADDVIQSGWYVGAGAGRAQYGSDAHTGFDGIDETDGADETQTIGRLVAGYRFMPWLGLEAIYQTLGTYRIRVEGSSAGTALALDRVAEVDAYAVAALGHYPLKRGSFFARLGAARWRVESATTSVAGGVVQRREDEERGNELVWGLGYEHPVANGALRIGYEEIANVAIDPDEDDLRLIAFDVLLRF